MRTWEIYFWWLLLLNYLFYFVIYFVLYWKVVECGWKWKREFVSLVLLFLSFICFSVRISSSCSLVSDTQFHSVHDNFVIVRIFTYELSEWRLLCRICIKHTRPMLFTLCVGRLHKRRTDHKSPCQPNLHNTHQVLNM